MSTQPSVLYITYDGLTDPLGQSQILPYLQHLCKEGYRFTIISFEKQARLNKEGKLIQSIVDAAGIRWVPLIFTAKPPILSKVWDRWRMWQKAKALYLQHCFDLVHCRSYVAAETGLRLKKQYGVKMLFDMRGFWADEKVDNGQWNQQHLFFRKLYRHYKKKEKAFLLSADAIVSLTHAAKNHLLQQPLFKNLIIEVIPCCADLDHFNYHNIGYAQVQQIRAELKLPAGAKVITYLGSVGGWYMTQEMFAFFKQLLQAKPEYYMLVLTKDDPGKIKSEAAACGVDLSKLIITYATRQQLPLYLAVSNCSIFFIRNTFSKIASSPTKHAELMGMGLPVICNDIGDTGHIISQTGTGMLVLAFDETTLLRAVNNIATIEGINKAHIRQCAYTYFDLQKGTAAYASLYRSLFDIADPPQI